MTSLKRLTKRLLGVIAVAAILAYTAVAASPLPQRIARHSPEQASLFRPPWFNFFADYDEGSVLGFKIGSTREQLVETLVAQYEATGELQAACARGEGAPPLSVADSKVLITDLVGVRRLVDRDVTCLYLPARRIMLTLKFRNDLLRSIELAFVRNELVT